MSLTLKKITIMISIQKNFQSTIKIIPLAVVVAKGGHGNPLQYSCLENPMDRGPYVVHCVAKSWAHLKWLSMQNKKVYLKYNSRDTFHQLP